VTPTQALGPCPRFVHMSACLLKMRELICCTIQGERGGRPTQSACGKENMPIKFWAKPERKKNAVFWDETRRGSCKNRRFVGMYRLHHQVEKNQRARNNVNNG
jgi:hypothetical protein